MSKKGAGFIDISMIGDKALIEAFNRLPESLQKKVLRPALRDAARPWLATAQALCPVKTGKLKASLKLRAIKRSRRKMGAIVSTGTREELGISRSGSDYYPMAVEYGTRGRQPMHPFLRPAFEQNKTKAENLLRSRIKQGIARDWTAK